MKPPPNYSSRPMQYRLMILVGLLMTVILLMVEAAKPKNWEWMWNLGGRKAAEPAERVEPIDTRLPTTSDSSTFPSDSFEVPASATEDSNPTYDADSLNLEHIPPHLFDAIQDDTYFRPEEAAAWFALWKILKATPLAELNRSSVGEVGFAQLFRQTDELRGKLVTVVGTVRRVREVKPAPNDVGISRLWQCWLRPNDGSNSPIVVYSLELHPGFPVGDDVHQPAQFTGFCFKRWAYSAQAGTMIAPVVLAKSPMMLASTKLEKREVDPQIGRLVVLLSLFVGLIAAAGVVLLNRRRRIVVDSRDDQKVAALAEQIRNEDLPSPEEQLRRIQDSSSPDGS